MLLEKQTQNHSNHSFARSHLRHSGDTTARDLIRKGKGFARTSTLSAGGRIDTSLNLAEIHVRFVIREHSIVSEDVFESNGKINFVSKCQLVFAERQLLSASPGPTFPRKAGEILIQ